MKYDFEHYLQAGHGRAYVIARADPERYRDRIMAACRKDYSFDMQSEGSRAFLTYDLISLFDDPTPFIEAIKESYKDPVADEDWKQICYLSVRETSYKWNVSERRVNQYVTEGRIPGVERFGRSWAIPENAKKPEDPRRAKK